MQEHERIFECYINDLCPVCGCKVDGDSFNSHNVHGGKTISYDFECDHCNSHYIVGLERACKPIKSQILIDGTKRINCCDLTNGVPDTTGTHKTDSECGAG